MEEEVEEEVKEEVEEEVFFLTIKNIRIGKLVKCCPTLLHGLGIFLKS